MTSSADVDVGDLEDVDALDQRDGAKGDDGDRGHGAGEGDHGSDEEERAIDGEGRQVFLEEELDAVGERLQKAEGADAGGAPAILHATEDLALEQHGVGDGRQGDDEDHQQLDDFKR